MQRKKRVTILLSGEEYQRVEELAEQSLRTRAGYLRHLVSRYLRHIEKHPEDALD